MAYYESTDASRFGGVAPRGNQDLERYVDSILPETFRPSFGEDLDARRSLDLDLGAASLWPDDSRDSLDACLDFSGNNVAGFSSDVSYNDQGFSSLCDVLGEDSDQRLRDSRSSLGATSPCSGRKGYRHRHTRKYLRDERLQKERNRELNNEASVLYRERQRATTSKKEKQLEHLQQENDQLCQKMELLTVQSDWCHNTYEKYSEYFAGPLDDNLYELR
ncbi:uncharacterized protein LOC119593285 [Penaeus monodon]|uniref:uncharacterized protein LOC119593284 n=1 Tax=Penaeus monodon TaxID=6687 RepID=UPI0018A744DA|nr:uncharacterized protein LOC119593284 [Penaeus monodon]XP_037798142.1 uncharacterized protein LOC119593285 [Penaeus monodon]